MSFKGKAVLEFMGCRKDGSVGRCKLARAAAGVVFVDADGNRAVFRDVDLEQVRAGLELLQAIEPVPEPAPETVVGANVHELPPRHGKPWSSQEEATARAMWAAGKLIADVCRYTGRSHDAVLRKLATLDGKRREDIAAMDAERRAKAAQEARR